jgi:hypothetical protein
VKAPATARADARGHIPGGVNLLETIELVGAIARMVALGHKTGRARRGGGLFGEGGCGGLQHPMLALVCETADRTAMTSRGPRPTSLGLERRLPANPAHEAPIRGTDLIFLDTARTRRRQSQTDLSVAVRAPAWSPAPARRRRMATASSLAVRAPAWSPASPRRRRMATASSLDVRAPAWSPASPRRIERLCKLVARSG